MSDSVGPGGITKGSYKPQDLSQEQRQWLYEQHGHSGVAPVGYGGEGGSMNIDPSTGQSSVDFPNFSYDYEAEQKSAYESLKPFYEKIAAFAQGDLDLAKRILQYTYDTGMRETKQEYETNLAEAGRLAPEETAGIMTAQNRRGVLESGFGQQERQRLSERQTARADAINRAYESRTGKLEQDKAFGEEEAGKAFEKGEFQTERDKRQEARGIAQDKFGIKQSQYQTQLAQAQKQETERIRTLEEQAQKDFYSTYGYDFG